MIRGQQVLKYWLHVHDDPMYDLRLNEDTQSLLRVPDKAMTPQGILIGFAVHWSHLGLRSKYKRFRKPYERLKSNLQCPAKERNCEMYRATWNLKKLLHHKRPRRLKKTLRAEIWDQHHKMRTPHQLDGSERFVEICSKLLRWATKLQKTKLY